MSNMKLTEIPQILTLLQAKDKLSAEQKGVILAELSAPRSDGKSLFAGEIGIQHGFFTKEALDHELANQAAQKAEASVKDLQTILNEGPQTAPPWLKANWGNQGINVSATNPSRVDGASAAANIAHNIVMLVNTMEAPQTLSKEDQSLLTHAVSAAANLVRGIHQGSSAKVPLEKYHNEWLQTMQKGLTKAVELSGTELQSSHGKDMSLDNYLTHRTSEIQQAVQATLSDQKNHAAGRA